MRKLLANSFRAFVCLLCVFSINSYAQSTKEVFSVTPKGFEQPYELTVHLPKDYAKNTDKKYFVIFDLHPKSPLYLSGLHDWLSHNGEWPWLETIVVTPSIYHKEFAALFNATAEDPSNMRMLEVVENNILAEVDQRYRTNGFRMYSGFMGNGAFGLYALINKPEMFNALFLSTPSLNGDFLNITSQFSDKLKNLEKYQRFIYMSIGDHGYEKSHIPAFKEVKNMLSKEAPKSLEWHADDKAENYYMSRPVLSLVNGIELLFDDIHNHLAADSDISKQGFDAIVEYYKKLSNDKYGFDVSAEGSLKNLAKATFASNAKNGLGQYERIIALYPDSAYAHSDYAEKLAEQGQIDKAIAMQKIAVDKAKTMVEWHQRNQQKKLDALVQKASS